MGILDIFKTKKPSEFSREDLEVIAKQHNIDFKPEIIDEELQSLVSKAVENLKKPSKKVKVKFLKSPTGLYGLGYNIGDKASVDSNQADEMIETGYAEKAK